MVEPEASDIPQWREKVTESNRMLADQGILSAGIMDEMLGHITTYRSGNTP